MAANYPTSLDDSASLFVAVDLATTTLSTNLTAAATTASLTSAARFDSNGGVFGVGNELIKYTGKTSNDLTGLSRGYTNSTAAIHDSGDTVNLVVAADYHNNLKDAVVAAQTQVGIDGSENFIKANADGVTLIADLDFNQFSALNLKTAMDVRNAAEFASIQAAIDDLP